MKKIKISIIAVIAIVMGIAGSAFTTYQSSNTLDEWFIYDGIGLLSDPASYSYSGSTPTCTGHASFCEFKGIRQAVPNDDMPTQVSLNSASSQSSTFTVEKPGLVVFQP